MFFLRAGVVGDVMFNQKCIKKYSVLQCFLFFWRVVWEEEGFC